MSDINMHMTFEDDDGIPDAQNSMDILDLHGVAKGRKLKQFNIKTSEELFDAIEDYIHYMKKEHGQKISKTDIFMAGVREHFKNWKG